VGVASVQAVAELQIQGVTPDALSTSDLRLGDGGGWGAGDRGSSDLEIAGPCWRSSTWVSNPKGLQMFRSSDLEIAGPCWRPSTRPSDLQIFRSWDLRPPRAFRSSDLQILRSRAHAGAQAPGLRTFRFSGRGISTPRAFRSSDLQILRSKEAVTRCGGDVVCRSGCRVCTACGQGSGVAQTVSRCHELKGDTEFDKTLKRSAKSLRTCNNIWGRFAAQSDPNYAPEWTKRRRL